MEIKEIREFRGLNKRDFASRYGIPYRTLQNWENGTNKCPDYVRNLLEFKVRSDVEELAYLNTVETVKFELIKNYVEIKRKDKERIVEGCTVMQENGEPEIIKSFDNKEDALKELEKYETEIDRISAPIGTIYGITEYYVQETAYNGEGDFLENSGIWKFTEMPAID